MAYEEPFANSLALLLANPDYDWQRGRWLVDPPPIETVNDLDPFISNFWRALQHDPDGVADHADWPVSEADLHARHLWLVKQGESWFRDRMMEDPDFYDVKIAGWWVWGACQWIGSGWCALDYSRGAGRTREGGVEIKRPELQSGKGVHRLSLQRPELNNRGNGIHRGAWQRAAGQAQPDAGERDALHDYFYRLAERLRYVRVTCGDWSRVTGRSVTWNNTCARGSASFTSIVLDPPYSASAGRKKDLYAEDDLDVAHQVREWCLEEIEDTNTGFAGPRYEHPRLRIVLFGYAAEHDHLIPDSWERIYWTANGGYSNQNKAGNDNRTQETIWFSPNCIRPDDNRQRQLSLFGDD